MGKWKEYKLRDVADVQTGPFGSQLHASDYVATGIPCIMPTNIGSRLEVKLENIAYVREKDAQRLIKYRVKAGDIVYSRRGDVEKCAFIKKAQDGWMCGTGCLRIRLQAKEVNPQFCAYYLSTPEIRAWVSNSAVGTTMPNLNSTILETLPLIVPPLPEQKSIASILGSLDDKIDLLHRQNKTLESLAETLFRQWFVEEAAEGWETGKLGDYVNCINGYSYKSSELRPSKNALVTLKSFDRNGGFSIEGFKEFTGEIKPHQVVQEGDLVVAHTDITQEAEVIGNPALVIADPKFENLVISMDLVKVVPTAAWISKEFIYFLMRSREFKYHCLGCANGTTVLHLNKEAIPSFEFKIPKKEKVIGFSIQAKELIQKMFTNHKQIRTITRLRDTLLPKLMSGGVRVKDAEKRIMA